MKACVESFVPGATSAQRQGIRNGDTEVFANLSVATFKAMLSAIRLSLAKDEDVVAAEVRDAVSGMVDAVLSSPDRASFLKMSLEYTRDGIGYLVASALPDIVSTAFSNPDDIELTVRCRGLRTLHSRRTMLGNSNTRPTAPTRPPTNPSQTEDADHFILYHPRAAKRRVAAEDAPEAAAKKRATAEVSTSASPAAQHAVPTSFHTLTHPFVSLCAQSGGAQERLERLLERLLEQELLTEKSEKQRLAQQLENAENEIRLLKEEMCSLAKVGKGRRAGGWHRFRHLRWHRVGTDTPSLPRRPRTRRTRRSCRRRTTVCASRC